MTDHELVLFLEESAARHGVRHKLPDPMINDLLAKFNCQRVEIERLRAIIGNLVADLRQSPDPRQRRLANRHRGGGRGVMADSRVRYVQTLQRAASYERRGKLFKAVVELEKAKSQTSDHEELLHCDVWAERLRNQMCQIAEATGDE